MPAGFNFFSNVVKLSDGHGVVRVVRAADGSWVRVLEVGGVYQSATYLDERWAEPVFNYYRGFDAAFEVAPGATRLLMIGGGGYAWPKHVLATQGPEVTLDVVELEPAITQAAKKWFFLDRAMKEHPGHLNLIEGDGRAFLDEHAARATALESDGAIEVVSYDVIVLDAFTGIEPVRSLATVEAFSAAKGCLAPGGALLANVVSNDDGRDVHVLQDLVATAREVFAHVYVVMPEPDPFAIEDNYLLVATDSDIAPREVIPYDEGFLGTVQRD